MLWKNYGLRVVWRGGGTVSVNLNFNVDFFEK